MNWLVCRRCGVTAAAGDLVCGSCTANLAEPGAVTAASTGDLDTDESPSSGDGPAGETS